MIRLYTVGFAGRSPEEFFGTLRRNGIRLLADVRRNNASQMAGFTKKGWIEYFLRELAGCDYIHLLQLAPKPELLKAFRQKLISWEEYEREYLHYLERQHAAGDPDVMRLREQPSVLLCSEPSAERCHRRVACEYLQSAWGDLEIVHL